MKFSDTALTWSNGSESHTTEIVSRICLAVLDRHCTIRWVSERLCNLTRYDKHELIGLSICELNLVCLTPENFNIIHAVIASGKTWEGEVKSATRDGSHIWVKVDIRPILTPAREIDSYLVFVTDISTIRNVIENLRKSEARYRALVNSQSDMISLCRLDGIRLFVNQRFCDFIGKTEGEVVGKNITSYPLKGLPDHIYDSLFRMTMRSPEISGVFELEGADGNKVWMSVSFKGIFDSEGNLCEVLTIGRDVTELKTAEMNKTRYIEELERMAFITSHMVRAPISQILGLLELLKMNAIHSGEWESVLKQFKTSIGNLDNYTRELCDFIHQSKSSK